MSNLLDDNHRLPTETTDEYRFELGNRLNSIEGQIRGIRNMVMNDTFSDEVFIQISSVRNALHSLAKTMFEAYLENCIAEKNAGREEAMEALMTMIKKMLQENAFFLPTAYTERLKSTERLILENTL